MMNDRKLLQVFDRYGFNAQVAKLHEEVQELDVELERFRKGEGNFFKAMAEMTDVLMLVNQFRLKFAEDFKKIEDYKEWQIDYHILGDEHPHISTLLHRCELEH